MAALTHVHNGVQPEQKLHGHTMPTHNLQINKPKIITKNMFFTLFSVRLLEGRSVASAKSWKFASHPQKCKMFSI